MSAEPLSDDEVASLRMRMAGEFVPAYHYFSAERLLATIAARDERIATLTTQIVNDEERARFAAALLAERERRVQLEDALRELRDLAEHRRILTIHHRERIDALLSGSPQTSKGHQNADD